MSPVKDFSNEVRKKQVEDRAEARAKAQAEQEDGDEVLLVVTRHEDTKVTINPGENVRPIPLMIGLIGQHFELMEQTMTEMALELQELKGTGIQRAKGPLQPSPGG